LLVLNLGSVPEWGEIPFLPMEEKMNKEKFIEFVEIQTVLIWGYLVIAIPAVAGVGPLGPVNGAETTIVVWLMLVAVLAFIAAVDKALRAAAAINAVLVGTMTGISLFACMCAGFQTGADLFTVPAAVVVALATGLTALVFAGAVELFEALEAKNK